MRQLAELLRAQPDHDQLVQALRQWTKEPVFAKLSTQDASVARALVSQVLPNYWETVRDTNEELKQLLIDSLASLAGINALLLARDKLYSLQVLQEVIQAPLLSPRSVIQGLSLPNSGERSQGSNGKSLQVWSRYLALVAGGQVVGQVAEVLSRFDSKEVGALTWLADRRQYSACLTKQCLRDLYAFDIDSDQKTWKLLGEYISRAASLGEPYEVAAVLLKAGLATTDSLHRVALLFRNCIDATKIHLFAGILRYLQESYLTTIPDRNAVASLDRDADRIGAVATLLTTMTDDQVAHVYADALLLQSGRYTLSLRRAIIAVFDTEKLATFVHKSLERWADPTFIKHASVLDQEALTETILVASAYLPFTELAAISKSKVLTNGISSHLESTSDRIRCLGMILAETISAQVIKDVKKRLTFGVPDTETIEAQWWRALIQISDTRKDLTYLNAGLVDLRDSVSAGLPPQEEDTLDISEFIDEADYSDEEFPSMRVPDSDDEDSDEDPTLIDRERLRPPVYIRDLIKMINNHDSYKHVSLALKTAPSLIRRKANYGTEVSDYAINLTQIFAGLRDNFDMDDFQDLRQETLKALVVSSPTIVCPYLAQTFFTGDYSLQQRVIILSAIALGARELAGEDEIAPQFRQLSVSKILPPKVLRQYQSIESLSANMQAQILEPMAADAVDSVSGPAALKVAKVTRQMTRTKQQVVQNNKLTAVAAEYFLFPLMGRFQMHAGKMVNGDAKTFYEANLLAYYLRTLSLVFQAASKSPALSRLTLEFWSLLLSLRSQSDHSVLEALLLAFLVIIDVNDNRRLALECSRQLIETQEWCSVIFEYVREEKIKVLAAGILLRIRDVVDANQVLMMQSAAMVGNIGRGRFGLAGLK